MCVLKAEDYYCFIFVFNLTGVSLMGNLGHGCWRGMPQWSAVSAGPLELDLTCHVQICVLSSCVILGSLTSWGPNPFLHLHKRDNYNNTLGLLGELNLHGVSQLPSKTHGTEEGFSLLAAVFIVSIILFYVTWCLFLFCLFYISCELKSVFL